MGPIERELREAADFMQHMFLQFGVWMPQCAHLTLKCGGGAPLQPVDVDWWSDALEAASELKL